MDDATYVSGLYLHAEAIEVRRFKIKACSLQKLITIKITKLASCINGAVMLYAS